MSKILKEDLPIHEDVDLLRDFLNTASSSSGESLATPEDLAHWLARRSLADATASVDAGDVRNAHELRRGLRELVRRRESAMSAEALKRLNEAAGSHLSAIRFEINTTGHRVFLDNGWTRVRGRLLETTLALLNSPRWARFKYCNGCDAVFYDDSTNRSAVWCSQQCSNRMSSRNWRRRHPEEAKRKSRRSTSYRFLRNLSNRGVE